MLYLSRRLNEVVILKIPASKDECVIRIHPSQYDVIFHESAHRPKNFRNVVIGFDAPKKVQIIREELLRNKRNMTKGYEENSHE